MDSIDFSEGPNVDLMHFCGYCGKARPLDDIHASRLGSFY